MAVTVSPQPGFQPYVPATQSPAEFTLKAIVIGVVWLAAIVALNLLYKLGA